MMNPNDFNNETKLARLALYKKYLEKNQVPARLIEAQNAASIHLLLAPIGEIEVQISFVPIPEDHYQSIEIMQYFIELGKFDYDFEQMETLCNALNQKMALGKVVLNPQSKLELRYYSVVLKGAPLEEVIFSEFFATLLTSVEFIVEIISSGLPLEELLDKIKGY